MKNSRRVSRFRKTISAVKEEKTKGVSSKEEKEEKGQQNVIVVNYDLL